MRVPASFCGLYGIRPTHGRLDLTGMMAQAPSSDTTGWFARDAETFARVSAVLLDEPIVPASLPTTVVVAVDAFGLADAETAAALEPMVRSLAMLVGHVREDLLAPPGLSVWARAQRTLQSSEAWLTFRDWLDRDNPRLAFSVARGLIAAALSPRASAVGRADARARPAPAWPGWSRPGTILCLPTTPFPAPRKGLSLTALEPVRGRITCLAAHGGLTGVPQVSLPGATVDGRPIGCPSSAPRQRCRCWSASHWPWRQPMTDLTPNIPEVVAEVRALFERYEQALIDKDVDVLDATFWDSPHTIRYALARTATASTRSTPTASPGRPGRDQGAAHPPGDPDARPRPRHREPRVQGARPRADRPPEPDMGAFSRTWAGR